jgi:sulfonate transport system permease protein
MRPISIFGAFCALFGLVMLWEMAWAGTDKSGIFGFLSLARFASEPQGALTSLIVVLSAALHSLVRIAVCLAIAYPLALLTASTVFLLPFGPTVGQAFFMPLRAVPLLALVPLFNIWFGDAGWSLYLYIGFAIYVVTTVGAISALSRMPPSLLEQAKVARNSASKSVRSILIPAAHHNLSDVRETLASLVWAFALAAEFLSADSGLGSFVIQAYQNNNVGQLAALLTIYALLALGMISLLRIVQSKLRWNQAGWEL